MTTTTLVPASEGDARRALSAELIESPGPRMLRLAQRALGDAGEALSEDPDVTSSDRGHEYAGRFPNA
jgi:hypothetical protein